MESSVSKVKCRRYKKWTQGKSRKFDNWFMMHFDLFKLTQSNQSIKTMTICFMKPMVFSNLKFKVNRDASTIPAGPGRTVRQERLRSSLQREPWTSFPPSPSPYLRTPCCGVLTGGFLRLWGSHGKPWWPRLNLRWWISIKKWWFVGVTFGCNCTCTEDTLQWRHQDCLPSISKLWMPVFSEQRCCFGRGTWLSVEEVTM